MRSFEILRFLFCLFLVMPTLGCEVESGREDYIRYERDENGNICGITTGCRDWTKITADDGTEVDVRIGPDGVSLELHAEGESAVCTPKTPEVMEKLQEELEPCECGGDSDAPLGGGGRFSGGSVSPTREVFDFLEAEPFEPGECRAVSVTEVIIN